MQLTGAPSVEEDVIEASQKWYSYLYNSEKSGRLFMSVLSAFLVFVGSLVVIFVSDMTSFKLTSYIIQYGPVPYFEITGVVAIVTGVLYYIFASRHRSKYARLHEDILMAKTEGKSKPQALLMLVSEMIEQVLPTVRQAKYDSAFLYGVIAFFLTAFLFPWNLILAIGIWLYFRYEASSEYNREIMRFDNWKLRLQSLL